MASQSRGASCASDTLADQVARWLRIHGVQHFRFTLAHLRGSAKPPHFLCCYRGRFIALELSAQNQLCGDGRIVMLRSIQAAGGVAVVVRTLEEVIKVFSTVDSLLSRTEPRHD